jgi:hypothetical protein
MQLARQRFIFSRRSKATTSKEPEKEVSALEALAVRLDAMTQEATHLGEERVAQLVSRAAKSARHTDKQREARFKKVGSIVEALKAKGLSAEEIIAALTR